MSENREPCHVAVPGATIAYFVRGDADPDRRTRPLLLVGSPMDSTGFTGLAGHVPARVVVTVDPRNTGASRREDPTAPVTPAQHAADLRAVIEDLGAGSVDVFATSGGAVNALALVADHPELVRVLVAHEPPAAAHLPDAERVAAAGADIVAAYERSGRGPAMARFIALVMHRGEVTDDYLARPAPDPAQFGLPAEDDGGRGDPLIANLSGGGIETVLDVAALRAASTRIVIGVGEESGGPADGEIAARSAYAVAAALGTDPVLFPGGHDGFRGGQPGQHGRSEEFAVTLARVLAGTTAA